MQTALILKSLELVIPTLDTVPKIFKGSFSVFSSSPEIYGTTFSLKFSFSRPAFPAPDSACKVVTDISLGIWPALIRASITTM